MNVISFFFLVAHLMEKERKKIEILIKHQIEMKLFFFLFCFVKK